MEKIVNLTPHDVFVVVGEKTFNFKKSENPARLEYKIEPVGSIHGIPFFKTSFGKPINLPEPEESTYYIVSQVIKSGYPERKDLIVPCELVRDTEGRITGCKGFQI